MDEYTDEELQNIIYSNGIVTARGLADWLHETRSIRSVQRDIKNRGLILAGPDVPSQTEVDAVVAIALPDVGPVYGRKTMTGFLRSKGHCIGEGRVGKALRRMDPVAYVRRSTGTSRQLNPLAYHAPYFGYNWHIDQNEKLVDYGVVICGIVDGASNFVLGFNIMSRKNPILIYQDLYKPCVDEFGLPDCFISDCGKEFVLAQHVQEGMQHMRIDTYGTLSQRPPIKKLKSTENNRIERMWVMVNDRCTYPLKNLLCNLHETGRLNMLDERTKNAVSFVAQGVCHVLLLRLRDSWNCHTIPRHGKPVDMLVTNQAYRVPIPSVDEAINSFTQSGGQLTAPWDYGVDVVPQDRRAARDAQVEKAIGGFEILANLVLADDADAVESAVNSYLAISSNFA